jgi:hypothetical protein
MSSIDEFFNDIVIVIKEKLNLDDILNYEYYYNYEKNGLYYYLYKSAVKDNKIKIIVKRSNYRQGNIRYYNFKPRGKRLMEEAYIYKNINLPNSNINFSLYEYKKILF